MVGNIPDKTDVHVIDMHAPCDRRVKIDININKID